MLLNHTDVVDEKLEKVIITMRQTSETMSRATSTLPEKLQKPPVQQTHAYSLDECILVRMLNNN